MRADLVLTDGHILTMNTSQFQAEAIAIKKDRIVQVGTKTEVGRWIGKETKVINLEGKTVVPGFIDTHVHVADFGRMLTWVDLSDVNSISELMNRVQKRVQKTPKGKWIIGRGWDDSAFIEKRYPNLDDLDSVSPNNPVVLYRQKGRVCVVNTKALELAGIGEDTDSSLRDEIAKDRKTGKLTGILNENATDLVWKMIPEPSDDDIVEAIVAASQKMVEAGLTSVHWIVTSTKEISILQRLCTEDKLPLRAFLIIPANLLDEALRLVQLSSCNLSMKLGGVMIFVDGFLAARTAALGESYSDNDENKGQLFCTQRKIRELVTRIRSAHLQPIVHAMGDRAIDVALTALAGVPKENSGAFLFRLEQAAVLDKSLIQRMKKQNIIVSVQPCVVASEFLVWSAVSRLGNARARWLYPLKTLLNQGICVAGGSDCPMEPLSPLQGIQASVTRESFPEERITVDDALTLYTINPAYSTCEEKIKGTIEGGKLADITVLSKDPRKVEQNQIVNIRVETTIVGGKVVYRRSSCESNHD